MQLTIFASIALLCSSVIAAPPQRRDGSLMKASDLKKRQTLADVNIDVTDVLDSPDITVARALIDVGVDVTDVLDNATIKVLSTRDSEEKRQTLAAINVDLNDDLENLDVNVARALIGVNVDVTDVLDNATVKVLSTRDSEEKRQTLAAINVDLNDDLENLDVNVARALIGVGVDVTDVLNNATIKVLST